MSHPWYTAHLAPPHGLTPRPAPFFFFALQFAFSIIHRRGRAVFRCKRKGKMGGGLGTKSRAHCHYSPSQRLSWASLCLMPCLTTDHGFHSWLCHNKCCATDFWASRSTLVLYCSSSRCTNLHVPYSSHDDIIVGSTENVLLEGFHGGASLIKPYCVGITYSHA